MQMIKLGLFAGILFLSSSSLRAEGVKGQGVDYSIDTSASSTEVKVGERGQLVIAIVASKGRELHQQAPLSVSLRAPAGIVLDKAKLGRADATKASKDRVELRVGFSAKSAGDQNIDASASFFVCTEKWCQRASENISVTIHVR